MLPGQSGQFDAKVVRINLQPVVVCAGQFHDEIVRHQGPALRDDRGAVVHLTLYGAGDLYRLDLGFERPREGTLNHAFEPSLEALQHSHPGTSFPCSHPIVSAVRVHMRSC